MSQCLQMWGRLCSCGWWAGRSLLPILHGLLLLSPAPGLRCRALLSQLQRNLHFTCRAGVPTDGWLIGNHSPTAADFAAAFPLEQVDFEALANPPGERAMIVVFGCPTGKRCAGQLGGRCATPSCWP